MSYDHAGKLVLRLSVGGLLLLHGLHKLTHGVQGIMGMLAARGWPEFFAYGAYVGEVVAPLLLIIGLFTRPAALIVVVHMLMAFYLAHTGQLLSIDRSGGWALELQGMFLFGALAIFLLGAGRYSMGSSRYE